MTPSPWLSPSHGHLPLAVTPSCSSLQGSTAQGEGELPTKQFPGSGMWKELRFLLPITASPWHSHPGSPSFPCQGTGLPVATSPCPQCPAVPDASTPTQCCPFQQLFSICSSQLPEALQELQGHPPVPPRAGQQNPQELEEGAGGAGWAAMAIPRDPEPALSSHKGPGSL